MHLIHLIYWIAQLQGTLQSQLCPLVIMWVTGSCGSLPLPSIKRENLLPITPSQNQKNCQSNPSKLGINYIFRIKAYLFGI